MERNQESFIVVMGVIAISSMAILQQTQQVQATLFRGPGYDAGYAEGKDDYLVGNAKEYDCSPNNSDDYCQDYRNGYDDGWEKQEDLGRSQGGYERDDN
jgi:hypothetical protein